MSAKSKDLDETRRLLYIGLAAGRDHLNVKLSEKADLTGTLAHALAHHRGGGYDIGEALEFAIGLVKGANRGQAYDLIRLITSELEALEGETCDC